MASIDINKLIQESMSNAMVATPETPAVPETPETPAVPTIDTDAIHESMMSKVKDTISDAGDSVAKGAKKAYSATKDAVGDASDSVAKGAKKAYSATKDAVEDNPKVAAGAAGAAGLIGAGLMAKRYLNRKKK